MKKVLIALDYDPSSLKVAKEGYSFAKAMSAEVILMHVIEEPVYYSSTEYSPIMGFNDYIGLGAFQLDSIQGLQKAAQHFLDKLKHHLGDETIMTTVKDGEIAEVILSTAKDLNADMVVIGSHSRKWLENIVMGSVTEKVLNHTQIPLFIIPIKKIKLSE
ncbi:MAG: universal stress protein [Bacteroidota bacterium]|nr:universal stress protein [Odoribacter sp.]MDP3642446.1 universal stress protein [Bacteroidota bacterium]